MTEAASLRLDSSGPLGDGDIGEVADEKSPCEQTKRLRVLFLRDAPIRVGDPVKVRLGSPPVVLVAGKEVGHLLEPDAQVAEACLLAGFNLEGSIEEIDPESNTGSIQAAGQKG